MATENFPIIERGLKRAGDFFILSLQNELIAQKHVASGDLLESFSPKIYQMFDSLYLDVVSDVDYMLTVNDGNPNGVNVEPEDIVAWARQKGFNYSDSEMEKFAENVARQLAQGYLTPGGVLVASRRYNFIGYAFQKADSSGVLKAIEEDIKAEIDSVVGDVNSGAAIKLTIA